MPILKDAASTSLYGSSAGNGVILITTKKGKESGGTGLVRPVNSFAELSGDLLFWSYVFSRCSDSFKTLEIFLTTTPIIRGGG